MAAGFRPADVYTSRFHKLNGWQGTTKSGENRSRSRPLHSDGKWRQDRNQGSAATRVQVDVLETAWIIPYHSCLPRFQWIWRCSFRERRSRPCSDPVPFQCSVARLHNELLRDAATAERIGLRSIVVPLAVAFHSSPSGSSQQAAVSGCQPASNKVVMTAAMWPPTRCHLLVGEVCSTRAVGECSTRASGSAVLRRVLVPPCEPRADELHSNGDPRAHSHPWQWPASLCGTDLPFVA